MTANVSNLAKHPALDFACLRFLRAVPLALLTTLGLVLGMARLIATAPVDLPAMPEYLVPDIIMDVQEPVVVRDTKPVKPERVEPVPSLPPLTLALNPQAGPDFIAPVEPLQAVAPTLSGFSANVPIATLMVQPDYPHRAAVRGLEGYVDLSFDVTAAGSTANIKILAANPERVFNQAALSAVKNWKYSPVTVDGRAQPYFGMQQRLVFTLEK